MRPARVSAVTLLDPDPSCKSQFILDQYLLSEKHGLLAELNQRVERTLERLHRHPDAGTAPLPILVAKLYRPPVTPDLEQRTRLIEHLKHNRHLALTQISALGLSPDHLGGDPGQAVKA